MPEAAPDRCAPRTPKYRRLIAALALASALALAGCGTNSYDSSISEPASFESDSGGNCTGTNGNSAVAACHPDVQEIQDACPDNSGGQQYAAPTDACLEAVRNYR